MTIVVAVDNQSKVEEEKRKHEENRVEKDADEKQEKGNILLSLLIVYVL